MDEVVPAHYIDNVKESEKEENFQDFAPELKKEWDRRILIMLYA